MSYYYKSIRIKSTLNDIPLFEAIEYLIKESEEDDNPYIIADGEIYQEYLLAR